MADQSSSESAEQASYSCHDPTHQHEGGREGEIHALIHQGMAAMESELLEQSETGLAKGALPREEYHYGRFGLAHELGRAYRGMGQLEQAEAAYHEALSLEPLYASPRERSALYQDILLLYQESGDLDAGLS